MIINSFEISQSCLQSVSLEDLATTLRQCYFGETTLRQKAGPFLPDRQFQKLLAEFPARVCLPDCDLETIVAWLDAGATFVVIPFELFQELQPLLPPGRCILRQDLRELGQYFDKNAASLRDDPLLNDAAGIQIRLNDFSETPNGIPAKICEHFVLPLSVTVDSVTIEAERIARLDSVMQDVVVPFDAIESPQLHAATICELAVSDRPDGLWPTVVVDESQVVMGLVYSNELSIAESIKTGRGVYWSRSRNQLWRKGETSGDVQLLQQIDLDCDRDALRFVVRQQGQGFCHLNRRGCFDRQSNDLFTLHRHWLDRMENPIPGSYTARLMSDSALLAAKIREEADELIAAPNPDEVNWEAADLMYFAIVSVAQRGGSLTEVIQELARRSHKVTRRPGDAKPNYKATESFGDDNG